MIALRDEYEAIWRALVDKGLAKPTVFRIASPKLTRLALLEMCNGVAHWYSRAGQFSAQEISDYYAGLALDLVAARRDGHAIRLEDTAGRSAQELMALLAEAYPA